jgi:hypothetical protein
VKKSCSPSTASHGSLYERTKDRHSVLKCTSLPPFLQPSCWWLLLIPPLQEVPGPYYKAALSGNVGSKGQCLPLLAWLASFFVIICERFSPLHSQRAGEVVITPRTLPAFYGDLLAHPLDFMCTAVSAKGILAGILPHTAVTSASPCSQAPVGARWRTS